MSGDLVLTSHELKELTAQSSLASYPSLVSRERLYSEQLYSSLPLPTGSNDTIYVRILVLEASKTRIGRKADSSPLKACLRVEPLTKDLSYTALSYVWGDPESKPHTISCRLQDQHSPIFCDVPITNNVHAALCQIRKQRGEVRIWVDSICINQDNDEEKSSQISHMQEIYSWAEAVFIWLGEGNRKSDKAMRYLQRRARWKSRFPFTWLAVMRTRPNQRKQEMLKFTRRSWRDCFARVITAFGDGSRNVHLYEVLDGPWVHRAWTLQEVTLARKPIILCGNQVVQWEDLIHAIYSPSYVRLRDLAPDPVHGDTAESLIAGWCSIIDIWLNIPRQDKYQPREAAHSSSAASFATLAKNLDSEKDLHLGQRSLGHLQTTSNWFWGIASAALWIYGTVKFMIMIRRRTLSNADKTFWVFLAMAWISTSLIFIFIVRRCLKFCCFILCGGFPDWYSKRQTTGAINVLSGIHVALRERSCTDPRDRSFAMFGILQSLGAAFAMPNVRETVGETHRLFLQSLFNWNPSSLVMMIDAGCPLDDAPSWVPNWVDLSPCEWLTSRYTTVSPMKPTKRPTGTEITVKGSKLTIQGHSEGSVRSVVVFETTFQSSIAHILSLLVTLQLHINRERSYCEDDPYDEPDIFLFAILYGLAPRRGPKTETHWTSDEFGRVIRTTTTRLPRWEGPYHFKKRKQDFKSWYRLYQLLLTCLPPVATGETSSQAGQQQPEVDVVIDINAAVEIVSRDIECCKCLMRIIDMLQAERRCLFVTQTLFVGSGPLNMKVGDEVFLFPGVPVPMILYSHGSLGEFKVRGAALVHGLMHGEGFESKPLRPVTMI